MLLSNVAIYIMNYLTFVMIQLFRDSLIITCKFKLHNEDNMHCAVR